MHGALRDVVEIVASDSGRTYRLMYTVELGEVIYVLHAFQKKSKRGPLCGRSVTCEELLADVPRDV